MSHYSTYRRRGGGPERQPFLNFIEVAEVITALTIHVTYNRDVTVTGFSQTDFATSPESFNPQTITQFDVDTLLLTFQDNIAAETQLIYEGPKPGIESPQTVDLS